MARISQPLRENEEKQDFSILRLAGNREPLVGGTKPRSFFSPRYTKGLVQKTGATKEEVGVKVGQEREPKTMGIHIFKAFCGLFDSVTSILRDIKHGTLHLSGAEP